MKQEKVTIKFHSEARKEFFKASEYYEEQVGDDFIDAAEKVLAVIERQPSSGINTERGF